MLWQLKRTSPFHDLHNQELPTEPRDSVPWSTSRSGPTLQRQANGRHSVQRSSLRWADIRSRSWDGRAWTLSGKVRAARGCVTGSRGLPARRRGLPSLTIRPTGRWAPSRVSDEPRSTRSRVRRRRLQRGRPCAAWVARRLEDYVVQVLLAQIEPVGEEQHPQIALNGRLGPALGAGLLRRWLGTESRVVSRYLRLADGGIARSGQGGTRGAVPLKCSRTRCCRRRTGSSRRVRRRAHERGAARSGESVWPGHA